MQAQAVASTKNKNLIDWGGKKFDAFGMGCVSARHGVTESFFSDEVLIDLLDRYPRNRLQAWTMGTDPMRREDWKAVDTTGVSGEDLLAAVKTGRIWYNILRMDLFDKRYKDTVDQLYAEMTKADPRLKLRDAVGTLLLSSPNAQVYYHADGPPTTLFHVRGHKRMWIYPAGDTRFVSQEMMEEIFGSAMDEEVPFDPSFDQYADVFDLGPGDMVWWPQNAPHRIENGDSLNVSLSTRYHTDESEQRKLIYNANRFLRRRLGMKKLSVQETGPGASIKGFTYLALKRMGVDKAISGYVYQTDLRVDPKAPLGLRKLATPCKPPFSR